MLIKNKTSVKDKKMSHKNTKEITLTVKKILDDGCYLGIAEGYFSKGDELKNPSALLCKKVKIDDFNFFDSIDDKEEFRTPKVCFFKHKSFFPLFNLFSLKPGTKLEKTVIVNDPIEKAIKSRNLEKTEEEILRKFNKYKLYSIDELKNSLDTYIKQAGIDNDLKDVIFNAFVKAMNENKEPQKALYLYKYAKQERELYTGEKELLEELQFLLLKENKASELASSPVYVDLLKRDSDEDYWNNFAYCVMCSADRDYDQNINQFVQRLKKSKSKLRRFISEDGSFLMNPETFACLMQCGLYLKKKDPNIKFAVPKRMIPKDDDEALNCFVKCVNREHEDPAELYIQYNKMYEKYPECSVYEKLREFYKQGREEKIAVIENALNNLKSRIRISESDERDCIDVIQYLSAQEKQEKSDSCKNIALTTLNTDKNTYCDYDRIKFTLKFIIACGELDKAQALCEEIKTVNPELNYVIYLIQKNKGNEKDLDGYLDLCGVKCLHAEWEKLKRNNSIPEDIEELNKYCQEEKVTEALYELGKYFENKGKKLEALSYYSQAFCRGFKEAEKPYKKIRRELKNEDKIINKEKHWLEQIADLIMGKAQQNPSAELYNMDLDNLMEQYEDSLGQSDNLDNYCREIAFRVGEIYYMKYEIASIKKESIYNWELYLDSVEGKQLFRPLPKDCAVSLKDEDNSVIHIEDNLRFSAYNKIIEDSEISPENIDICKYKEEAIRFLYCAITGKNKTGEVKGNDYNYIDDIEKKYYWAAFYIADILISSEGTADDNVSKKLLEKTLQLPQSNMLYYSCWGKGKQQDIGDESLEALYDFKQVDGLACAHNAKDVFSDLKQQEKFLKAIEKRIYDAVIKTLNGNYRELIFDADLKKKIETETEKIKVKYNIRD